MKRSIQTFGRCGLAAGLFCADVVLTNFVPFLENENAILYAQSSTPGLDRPGILSPSELTGTTIRDFDAQAGTSLQYSISPSGQSLPQSEDDDWIPGLSLADSTEAQKAKQELQNAVRNPNVASASPNAGFAGYQPPNAQSPNAQSPNAQSPNAQTPNAQTPNAQTPNAQTNGANSVVLPSDVKSVGYYDPGFQVGGSAPSLDAPVGFELSGDEEGFASSDATLPSVPPQNNELLLNEYGSPDLPLSTPNSPASTPNDAETFDFAELAAPLDSAPLAVPGDSTSTETDLSSLVVADIRVSGLEMSTTRFNRLIKTKIGANFNQQTLEEDKRALLQTKQFVDVTVSTTTDPKQPGKIVVNFDMTPRRLMQYIKVVGNRRISKSEILEELGMKRGETRLDPYDVETGKLRIAEMYKGKNYNEPHIEILVGDRPEDVGVVYLVDEGIKQKVLKTKFVGNTVASSARLRSLVANKPGFFYIIGGEFTREKLDEDVAKLLEYYQKLGYFDARIDREYEESEGYTGLGKENAWITVRYIINEGPQYHIRNIYFNGNKVVSSEKLSSILKVKSGDRYNQNAIEGDRISLKVEYENQGYVLADVEPVRVFTEDEGYLDIRYNIKEDRKYRVRDVKIAYDGGEARTRSNVVLNMIDLTPGQLLNGIDIRNSETTLRRSGLFNDKPEQGILPTIAIVPDDKALPVESKTAQKPDEDKIRGQIQIPKNSKLNETNATPGSNRSDLQSAAKFNPGFVASENRRRYNAEKPQESSSSLVRGQTRQVPTSFGATTQGYGYANGSYSASNSGTSNSANATNSNSVYADASMYNNYNNADISQYGNGNRSLVAAPPILNDSNNVASNSSSANNGVSPNVGTSSVAGTSSTAGTNSTVGTTNSTLIAAAPGFNAAGVAGRDAVFPGSLEQEYYDSALFGGGGLTARNTINDADVIARIKETRTGLIQAQVGVNSDYGLVGNFSLTERNFDITRWPTSFWRPDGWTDAFRGAGQTFQLQAAPGTEVSRYSVSWDVPYVLDTKNCFGVTGLYGDRDYTEWFESRLGGEVRLGRQWTPRFSTSLISSAYSVKIKDPISREVPDLNAVLGTNAMYTVGMTATYDTRNHPFIPSKGYVLTASVEQAFGDFTFPRANLDARFYHTLHSRQDDSGRWILGLRSAAGWLGDDAPIYERFYGGGSNNLRGFEYREVTPRYANTFIGVGGNFEFYNSAEMLVPLSGSDEFQLALFVDSGTVSPNLQDWDTYRVAPGLGVRISIPMLGPAPLALDFAFPVSKGRNDVEQIFSFSMSALR